MLLILLKTKKHVPKFLVMIKAYSLLFVKKSNFKVNYIFVDINYLFKVDKALAKTGCHNSRHFISLLLFKVGNTEKIFFYSLAIKLFFQANQRIIFPVFHFTIFTCKVVSNLKFFSLWIFDSVAISVYFHWNPSLIQRLSYFHVNAASSSYSISSFVCFNVVQYF